MASQRRLNPNNPNKDVDVELAYFKSAQQSSHSSEQNHESVPYISSDNHLVHTEGDSALFNPESRFRRLRNATASSKTWKHARLRTWIAEPETSQNPHRGWRKAAFAAFILTAIVLVVNTILLIVAATGPGAQDGVGVLFSGDCATVERWDTGFHLLINVLGTCLLGASSFIMQCLSSPTRSETDAAHAKRHALKIGVPSISNLRHVHAWKGCLWWALALSTLPLHLFWNSTVFSTLGAKKYSFIVVDESFLSGAEYLAPDITNTTSEPNAISSNEVADPAVFLQGYMDGNYTRLSPSECLGVYTTEFNTHHRNLIVVTTPRDGMRMSPGMFFPTFVANLSTWYGDDWLYDGTGYSYSNIGYPQPLWNGSSVLAFQGSGFFGTGEEDWPCIGWTETGNYKLTGNMQCTPSEAQRLLRETGRWYVRPIDSYPALRPAASERYAVDYCLAETRDIQTCQLQYVSYILVVVIVCNLVKLVSMGLTTWFLWDLREPIFATVGDAVSSYMERHDKTTTGWCLMDFRAIQRWQGGQSQPENDIYERKPSIRIFSATTRSRWWWTMSLCLLYWVIGLILLLFSIATAGLPDGTKGSIWNEWGFGKVVQSHTFNLDGGSSSTTLIWSILIANSFQLVLSMTYFLFNSLWTAQCAAKEWASYATNPKPLRVTWPRGQQRSTYYLSLPYKYGLPLVVCLALLHFLISQSVFLARVQWYFPDGTIDDKTYLSDAGYSPLGIMVTDIVAAIVVVSLIVHSFMKLDNRMPLHGNLSAVISAACHGGEGGRLNDQVAELELLQVTMAQREVMWGVVKAARDGMGLENDVGISDDGVGHCAFADEVVDAPVQGLKYR